MAKAGYINSVAHTLSNTHRDNIQNTIVYGNPYYNYYFFTSIFGFLRVSFIKGIITGIVLAAAISWNLDIDIWISIQGNDKNESIATSEIRSMKVLPTVTVHKVFPVFERPLLLRDELQMVDNILHLTIMVERDEHIEHWKKVYSMLFGNQYVHSIVVSKGKYYSVILIHIMNICLLIVQFILDQIAGPIYLSHLI